MICRSCGALLKDSATRCPYCKLRNPDLYQSRKDSDGETLRDFSVRGPARPQNRGRENPPTSASQPSTDDMITIGELEEYYHKEENQTTPSSPPPFGAAPIHLPPHTFPRPGNRENTGCVLGQAAFWILIALFVVFSIVFNGCDAFLNSIQ